MHLHVKKTHSCIRKTKKSNILFTTTNSRKTFTKTKFYANNFFIVVAIKTLFEDKISIIAFIVNYSKNVEIRYNFCD